jgi:hypothetical protein
LALPVIAAVHAGCTSTLIGLGMLAMVTCRSGDHRPYLYTHIPRDRAGLELSLEQVAARARGCSRRSRSRPAHAAGRRCARSRSIRAPTSARLVRTFARLIADDWTRW